LKLSQLLSLYLYQTKRLDLPGIGSFTLDPAAVIPEQSDKNVHTHAEGITFKNTVVRTADDSLIEFIKEYTGKMKPLAAADLDFFLTTGKQLLNIGKPFYLEGIGTLMQTKEGQLEYTPGEYSTTKLQDHGPEKRERADKKTAAYEEPRTEHTPKSNNVRQVALLIGIIVGLVAIGWGGYYFYKKNTFEEQPAAERRARVLPDTIARKTTDTTSRSARQQGNLAAVNPPSTNADSLARAFPVPVPGPDQSLYKFVILETDRKNKALRRYNQLLGYQLNIKMEQKDSAYFKLYFPIAASPRDTAHIKDSLIQTYAARVSIER